MILASPLRPLLAAALLGLNLSAIAAPPPASIVFDTTPRAGQHQRQLMDMQAVMKMRVEAGAAATDEQRAKIAQAGERMAQMGPMKMSMQMQQTLQVGQADAEGWLPMTVTTGGKGVQLEVGGKAIPVPNPTKADVGFVARFNPRDFAFEVREVQGSPELSDMMRTQGQNTISQALQLFKSLKERPLKVGDSIDVPLTMNLPVPMPGGAGAMDGVVHYTLARLERGVAHFDLSMDLKLDINTPVPTPPGAASAPHGQNASAPAPPPPPGHKGINRRRNGQSTQRLADRLALATQLDMDMQMTMDMPDNGRMLVDMNMVMQSKGESLARPAATKKKS